MAHGEWSTWCESIGIPTSTARKFITVSERIGANRSTSNTLGIDALYLIATMPEEAREIPHIIPSTGETKTVDEMTVRELREVKAEYLLIAENVERRGQAEQDPIKKARIAQFLKEYWGVKNGINQHNSVGQNGQPSKTLDDIGEFIGDRKSMPIMGN